jgi:hypothetical protein
MMGNFPVTKLIVWILVIIAVIFAILFVIKFDIFNKLFGELPDYKVSVSEDLIRERVLLGNSVKILLDDGEGRCVVYEGKSDLKQYGIRGDKLEQLIIDSKSRYWKEVDDALVDDVLLWKRELKDKMIEKKNEMSFEYGGNVYSGNDILRLSASSEKEVQNAFSDFIVSDKNRIEFRKELLRFRLSYDDLTLDETENAIYWVTVGKNTFYSIDRHGRFYSKVGIGEWVLFDKDANDNGYLYSSCDAECVEWHSQLKEGLVNACENE